MNNVIFRAWDKIDKKMYYNVGVTPYEVIVYENTEQFPPKILFQRGRECFELMLGTDLYDKDGTMIYKEDTLDNNKIVGNTYEGIL